MRPCIPLFAAALLLGCSEYNLANRPHPQPLPADTGTPPVVETTPPEPEPEVPREEQVVVDSAVQADTFRVDVLWVVDNSCSMEDNQDALATHFPTFIDYFQTVEGLDYHVGVISTDVDDPDQQGKLREAGGLRWLEPGTPGQDLLFDQMARMGTDGSGDESGRAAIHHAITTHLNGWNAGFFRDDAALVSIVISDEDDYSDMFGVGLNAFVVEYEAFKPDPSAVSVSTIVGPVPGGCETADPGFGYEALRALVGGEFHDICQADWRAVLETLAAQASSATREFFLTSIPDLETLEVQVIEADGTELWFAVDVDFTYDAGRNSITFTTYIPGPLAEVNVHYVPDFGA